MIPDGSIFAVIIRVSRVAIVFFSFFAHCGHIGARPSGASSNNALPPVTNAADTIGLPAQVLPHHEVKIYPTSSGKIAWISPKAGCIVHAGEPLFRIGRLRGDRQDSILLLNISVAEKECELLDRQCHAIETKALAGLATNQEIEDARVQRSRAMLSKRRTEFEYESAFVGNQQTIAAPVSGLFTNVKVADGEPVSRLGTVIGSIFTIDTLVLRTTGDLRGILNSRASATFLVRSGASDINIDAASSVTRFASSDDGRWSVLTDVLVHDVGLYPELFRKLWIDIVLQDSTPPKDVRSGW